MYREPAELLLYIMHATHARTHGRTAARPHARTHAHTHARGLARARTHARMHARVVHARSTGSVFNKGSNNKMHARTHTCTHARTHVVLTSFILHRTGPALPDDNGRTLLLRPRHARTHARTHAHARMHARTARTQYRFCVQK